MAANEFRIVESRFRRRGCSRLLSKFVVTRVNGVGVVESWRLSLPALRLLVDVGSDVLAVVEERELAEAVVAESVGVDDGDR